MTWSQVSDGYSWPADHGCLPAKYCIVYLEQGAIAKATPFSLTFSQFTHVRK